VRGKGGRGGARAGGAVWVGGPAGELAGA